MIEEVVKGYCEALSGHVSRQTLAEQQAKAMNDILQRALSETSTYVRDAPRRLA